MDTATAQDSTSAPRRETALGVVGVAIGLLVLIASVGALVQGGLSKAAPLDGAALLRERFASAGPLPYGLALVGAEREPGGREVVRFESPRAALPPAPVAATAPGEPPPGTEGVDWVMAKGGRPPLRAALAWYPSRQAERVMREQFTSLSFEGKRGRGDGGGHGGGMGGAKPGAKPGEKPEVPEPQLQDAGTIPWAGYAAPFVRLREFELTDDELSVSFHESVRVNLSVRGRCCVLYLRWGDKEVGDREAALAVLATLEPSADEAPVTSGAD